MLGRRIRLGILAVGLAVPMACGAFGTEDVAPSGPDGGGNDAPPGVTDDGGSEPDAGESGSSRYDAGLEICDDFDREAALPSPLWSSQTGATPLDGGALEIRVAKTSTASRLKTAQRARGDTIVVRARLSVEELGSLNPDTFLRLLDIDASIDITPGEYSALELGNDGLRLKYRSFGDDGSGEYVLNVFSPVKPKAIYDLELVERFDPTDGFIRVTISEQGSASPNVNERTLLATSKSARSTWQLHVGVLPVPIGNAPNAKIRFDRVCLAP